MLKKLLKKEIPLLYALNCKKYDHFCLLLKHKSNIFRKSVEEISVYTILKNIDNNNDEIFERFCTLWNFGLIDKSIYNGNEQKLIKNMINSKNKSMGLKVQMKVKPNRS